MPIKIYKHQSGFNGESVRPIESGYTFSGRALITPAAKRLLDPIERTAIIVDLKRRVQRLGTIASVHRYTSKDDLIIVEDNLPEDVLCQYTPAVRAQYDHFTIMTEQDL